MSIDSRPRLTDPPEGARTPGPIPSRLQWVGPLAIILIALTTPLVVSLAPLPHRVSNDADLSDFRNVLIEPADKIVLATWLVTAAVLLVWTLWRGGAAETLSSMRALAVVLSLLAVVLAVLSLVVDVDESGLRPPLGAVEAILGVVLVTVMSRAAVGRPRQRVLVSAAVVAVLLALALPELWQTAMNVRDWDSSRFVLDELAAPATGRVPYGDYAPQYSALLGLPLVPALVAMPNSAPAVVLAWLVALQVVAIVVAVTLVTRSAGSRYVGLVALVIVAPCIATTPQGYSPTTYFASIPIRVLLPILTIASAYALLRRRQRRRTAPYVGLGLLAGAAVVNNPDFGGPVLGALVLVIAFMREPWRRRVASIGLVVLGAFGAAVAYGVWAWARGAPLSPDFTLVFQRVFGAAGYFNVAMPAVGLHVAVVSLFVAATVVGLVLVRRFDAATWLGRQGLVLALAGVWSVLSLGYYVGRSLTATLVGGYALQIGLVSASFVPLAHAAWRASPRGRRPPLVIASVTLVVVALVWCAGNLARVWAPWTYLGRSASASAMAELDGQVRELQAGAAGAGAAQMLSMPATTSLMSGVVAHPVVSSPDYLMLSRRLAGLQCRQWRQSGVTSVVMSDRVAAALGRSPDCVALLDLSAPRPWSGQNEWVVVVVRP